MSTSMGIVGYGIVGQALGKAFEKIIKVTWSDPYKDGSTPIEEVVNNSDILFVCVPTPMFFDGRGIDLSIVDSVIAKIAKVAKGKSKLVVIKSTVVPGTTKSYQEKYPSLRFAMNPEFLTEKNAEKDFLNPDRTVIGVGNKTDGELLSDLYKKLYGDNAKIFVTDTTSAEVVKYMCNTFLAMKVIFANEYSELCSALGVDYEGVSAMVAADPRIGESHMQVTNEKGFGGKCFPKDTVAILGLAKKLGVELSLAEKAWEKNLKIRKVRDWESINGAVNKGSSENRL